MIKNVYKDLIAILKDNSSEWKGSVEEMPLEKPVFAFVPGGFTPVKDEQFYEITFSAEIVVNLQSKEKSNLALINLFEEADLIRSKVSNANNYAKSNNIKVECEGYARDKDVSKGHSHQFVFEMNYTYFSNN